MEGPCADDPLPESNPDRCGAGDLLRQLFCISLLAASACIPPAKLGQQGRLLFAYQDDPLWGTPSLDTPVASSGRIEVRVGTPAPGDEPSYGGSDTHRAPRWFYPARALRAVRILSVASSNPAVLRVVSFDDGEPQSLAFASSVVLEGGAPGSTQLQVTTALGDDVIELAVARATRAVVENPIAALIDAPAWSFALIAGGTTQLESRLYGKKGDRLVGSDFPGIVQISPPDAAIVASRGLSSLFVSPSRPGDFLLRPYGAQPAMLLSVVSRDEIVGLALDLCPSLSCTRGEIPSHLVVGKLEAVWPRAVLRDGRLGLGLDGVVAVRSTTPEICNLGDGQRRIGDILALELRAEGTCHLEAHTESVATTRAWEVHPRRDAAAKGRSKRPNPAPEPKR